MTTYIWRDAVDDHTINIGSKNKLGYTIWASIYVDGVDELFGLTYEQFKLITKKPREIELTLEIL